VTWSRAYPPRMRGLRSRGVVVAHAEPRDDLLAVLGRAFPSPGTPGRPKFVRALGSVVAVTALAMTAAACGRAAEANESATTTTTGATAVPVETRLVVVSEPGETTATAADVDATQIEQCVKYVPYAAEQGNPYMQMTWASANEDLAELRLVCEELGRTNPEALQNIADEQDRLDAFFNQFTTTVAGESPAPTSAPVPGSTVPVCPPGAHLSDDGFCVAD
jgi:hypothetical protein